MLHRRRRSQVPFFRYFSHFLCLCLHVLRNVYIFRHLQHIHIHFRFESKSDAAATATASKRRRRFFQMLIYEK